MSHTTLFRVAALVIGLCLAASLAACTSDATPSKKPSFNAGQPTTGDTTVDSAELRAIKREAGIEPCPNTTARGFKPVNGLPEETLPCLGGGGSTNLAMTHGKPMVLNLWASWCGPCRKELPFIQQLHERAGDRVLVLGVDYQDTEPKAALELAAGAGVTYPLLADPKSQVRTPLKVVALPQTVFVNARGSVVATERRQIKSYDELASLVRKHLLVTP